MEINSKDKIQTEGNAILPKNDKNSIIKKRIGYFIVDEEDNRDNIFQTGFFCNIQDNSDKKKSIFLLTTRSKELCEFLEPEKSNKNGEPKESKVNEKTKANKIKFVYYNNKEVKRLLIIKDRKIYSDKSNYYGFKINEEDEINDCFEIEEQTNYINNSNFNYPGYMFNSGEKVVEICTIKGSKNCIKKDNQKIDCDFKEIKGDTIMKGGPVYNNNNYVIGILNVLKENKKEGIITPIKYIR